MNTWTIDQAHSEIGFKIKHLVISTVRGHFTNFEGTVAMPETDFSKAEISFSAVTDSINTNNEMRDGHLKSAEFFNTAEFPALSFKSNKIEKKSDSEFNVTGTINMHGVEKEIILSATLNGMTKDPYGNNVMGFDVAGSINRSDFGLVWNAPLETGGLTLSDEVKLEIIAEFKEAK